MKKQFITGFLSGALIFGVVGALAATYTATNNPFPVKLNGNDVQIEGYNIDGSTYFKLRDVADTVGGFDVGFNNNTIQLSKDGYVYEDTTDYIYEYAPQNNGTNYSYKLPHFNINSDDAKRMNTEIDKDFTELALDDSDVKDVEYEKYTNGDILSLCIKNSMTYNDVVGYTAKNINISTGKEVSNSELVKMAGITENELLEYVKTVLTQKLNEHISKISSVFDENSLWEYGLSEKCYGMNMPMYINEKQELIVVPVFATVAGGYREPLNTGYKVEMIE